MKRFVRSACAAAVLAVVFGVVGSAQTSPADCATVVSTPPGTPINVPPFKGMALMGYLAPKMERKGDDLVTTIRVKNLASGSIALLRVDEYWWDKNNTPAGGTTCRYRKPFLPGQILEITLRTRAKPEFARNNYQFSHANGEIKATLLKTLDGK